MTKATAIIDFISTMHGMDRLHIVGNAIQAPGAFDLLTGQCIEPAEGFPEGEMLIMGPINGPRVLVHTHFLLGAIILRTAQASSMYAGGIVRSEYERLKEHLEHKTGFSY